ncbi:hypothetical protein LAZ67_18002373 [Cordylochernes scorpioides]|uniref:Mos1 transposase HTH domain-containing protein n=1 Tax=Cordylochernes scorpioides TaxID=51811 RepID=A0ABY6LI21_9ARAC|nr:hypothetical protein LAZ67_18002373 [Cordylochernes scorpioides]
MENGAENFTKIALQKSTRNLKLVQTGGHCELIRLQPVEIPRQLVEVYGEKCMDIKNVRKWCREFNEGRINVHDEQRSGRPSLPESTVARIDEMVRANRRITLEEIEDGLNEDCSHFSVHKIVSETLGYRKVSAKWVDKWLKEAAGEWYNTGITKLVDRMKKVIEHQGDYKEEKKNCNEQAGRFEKTTGRNNGKVFHVCIYIIQCSVGVIMHVLELQQSATFWQKITHRTKSH